MGTFSQTLRLESINGERSVEVEALVDTGAAVSLVPAKLLNKLGVEPIDRIQFKLADSRPVVYDIGQAVATIGERTIPTLVAFGGDDDCPLLGAYTLEGLRLMVDPLEAKLVPVVIPWREPRRLSMDPPPSAFQ